MALIPKIVVYKGDNAMKNIKTIKKQIGTSLIEVMVSLVVMSTGMLGLLGMQTMTLQQSSENFSYNQANFLAQDLFARMTANADQVLNDDKREESLFELTFTESKSAMTAEVQCDQSSCNSEALAAWDMSKWQQKLLSSEYLPDGQAEITVDLDASGEFTYVQLTVRFLHNHAGGSLSISNASDDENAYEQFVFERNI
jgi:type IV pilus modification protein PilV